MLYFFLLPIIVLIECMFRSPDFPILIFMVLFFLLLVFSIGCCFINSQKDRISDLSFFWGMIKIKAKKKNKWENQRIKKFEIHKSFPKFCGENLREKLRNEIIIFNSEDEDDFFKKIIDIYDYKNFNEKIKKDERDLE